MASDDATKDRSKSDEKTEEKNITSELEFADWYNDLEHELLDSSHDDYTSVFSDSLKKRWLRTSTGTTRNSWNFLNHTWIPCYPIHPRR